MISFDKLFLVKDNGYGTHVTYINGYPDYIIVDFHTCNEDLENIIKDIERYIEIQKIKNSVKKKH